MREKAKIDSVYFNCSCEITSRKDLTSTDKLVYSFISNYWKNKMPFNAGTDYIIRCLGLSRASVFNSLDNLKKKHLIEVDVFKIKGKNPTREIYQYGSRKMINGNFIKEPKEDLNALLKKVLKRDN